MSVLTTATAVQGVMAPGNDYDGTTSLTPFIETAAAMVDDILECAAAKGRSISTARQELLQRWLAAHFYQQSDQGYTEKETERARGKFHGQTGMYLESTKYGQTAAKLDPSGCLEAAASSSERKVASLFWGGLPPSDQTDYEDRD